MDYSYGYGNTYTDDKKETKSFFKKIVSKFVKHK